MFRFSVHKIFNLQKQRAPEEAKDTSKGIILWGYYNDEPIKIINTINGSQTGRACIDTIKRYIYGMGLNIGMGDEPFKINGENVNRLHSTLSSQVAKLRGIAIWIGRNPEGKIMQLKSLPFENCRLGEPDDSGKVTEIKYNPYFGTTEYREQDTKTYKIYESDPEEALKKIKQNGKKWRGEIYYASLTDELNPFYPAPSWWSNLKGKGGGRKWMEIEQKISDFHAHNIDKGFLQQILMKIVGDPDAPIPQDIDKKNKGEKYRTVKEDFQKFLDSEFAGPEGDKIMVLWSEQAQDFPDVQAFPTNSNHQLFITLQRLTTENILIATQVPPVLAGVKVSGTLSKDDIENAVKLMWSMVEDEQSFLEGAYNELFPLLAEAPDDTVKVLNYSPVVIKVDEQIWNAMSRKEQRDWIRENTDIQLEEDDEEPETKEEIIEDEA
jgi:hypothetical protein